MAELAFEYLLLAMETTRGTAVDPPTRYLPIKGKVVPKQRKWRPDEARGVLAATTRSKTRKRWSELEGGGPLDVLNLHSLLAMLINGSVTSPSTPGGATNARLWTLPRTQTSDNLKAGTCYWGDPNVQAFQAAYQLLDELVITSDAGGDDGAMYSVKGGGAFPSKTAPASVPSQLYAPLINPAEMQFWLDTSSAIGTTEITGGKFVSAELTIPSGVTRKWAAAGAGASLNFSRIGRAKTSPKLTIHLELDNMTQYDLFGSSNGDTVVKTRVRLNGPEIESGFRYYVEWDLWAPFDELEWTEHEGTNRTATFTLMGEYDATAATDLIVRVQNNQTTLA